MPQKKNRLFLLIFIAINVVLQYFNVHIKHVSEIVNLVTADRLFFLVAAVNDVRDVSRADNGRVFNGDIFAKIVDDYQSK